MVSSNGHTLPPQFEVIPPEACESLEAGIAWLSQELGERETFRVVRRLLMFAVGGNLADPTQERLNQLFEAQFYGDFVPLREPTELEVELRQEHERATARLADARVRLQDAVLSLRRVLPQGIQDASGKRHRSREQERELRAAREEHEAAKDELEEAKRLEVEARQARRRGTRAPERRRRLYEHPYRRDD